MIRYLFSGIDKDTGFTTEQTNKLLNDNLDNKSITFISSVFFDHERTDNQVERYTNYFKRININFNDIWFIDDRISINEAKEIIKKSDIVFLLGGSPKLQMESLNQYGLKDLIKEKSIVLGVSAGSMNQANRVVYYDDFTNVWEDYLGLGLTNINIYPHYDDKKEQDEETKKINEEMDLYLLYNDSFVRIENEKVEIIGKYKILKK